jgi:preprotein translocase subunit YajC
MGESMETIRCGSAPSWAPLLAQGGGGDVLLQMVPFLAIGLLFFFLIFRQDKRQRNTHRQMVEALKKNDRVVTIGGLKGTVVQVRREIDEITLKVDDNTKIRFTLSAIARLDGAAAEEEKAQAPA